MRGIIVFFISLSVLFHLCIYLLGCCPQRVDLPLTAIANSSRWLIDRCGIINSVMWRTLSRHSWRCCPAPSEHIHRFSPIGGTKFACAEGSPPDKQSLLVRQTRSHLMTEYHLQKWNILRQPVFDEILRQQKLSVFIYTFLSFLSLSINALKCCSDWSHRCLPPPGAKW